MDMLTRNEVREHPALEALGPVAALDPSLLGAYMAQAQARAVRTDSPEGVPLYAVEGDGVAVVRVEGPLARRALAWRGMVWFDGYDRINAALAAADADPSVRARLLVVDSPGGAAAGLFDAARSVLEEPARTPLVSVTDGRAASAGMALFALGDETYVGAEDSIGSIGTIALHSDISRALENAGIKMTAIVDPQGKANAWPYWPLSDDAKAQMQEDVSALSAKFYEFIAARRGMKPESVKALNARMLMGQKAVDAGLANGVASYKQAFARAEILGRQKEKERVKNVYSLLGLPATASAEDVDKAAAAAAPLVELGRSALAATGESDASAAAGALEAMRKDAEEAKALRRELAAGKANAEQNERNTLLVRLAQVEPPVDVWNGGQKERGPILFLAEMGTPALRAYVKCREERAAMGATKALTETNVEAAEPTEAEIKAYAARFRVSDFIARTELLRVAKGGA